VGFRVGGGGGGGVGVVGGQCAGSGAGDEFWMGGCAGCCAGGGGGVERVGIVAGYQVFLSENQIQVSNLCAWILVPFEMKGRTLKKG